MDRMRASCPATVDLRGEIREGGQASLASLKRQIRGRKPRFLDVLLQSPGGDVDEAEAIASELSSLDDVHVHAVEAQSAAVLILAAASWRTCSPGALLLLHRASVQPSGRWTAAEHQAAAELLEQTDASIARRLARVTGTKQARLQVMALGERTMSTDVAVQIGLVHAVVDERTARAAGRAMRERDAERRFAAALQAST
jgi:ATP-dependent protease ClpP protease subunit